MNPIYSHDIVKFHIEKLRAMGVNAHDLYNDLGLSINSIIDSKHYYEKHRSQCYKFIQTLHECGYQKSLEITDAMSSVQLPSIFNSYFINSANILDLLRKVAVFSNACYPSNQVNWLIENNYVVFYLKQNRLEQQFCSSQGFLTYIAKMIDEYTGQDKVPYEIGVNAAYLPNFEGFCLNVTDIVRFKESISYIKIPLLHATKNYQHYNTRIETYLEQTFKTAFITPSKMQTLTALISDDLNTVIQQNGDKRIFNIEFTSSRHGVSRASLYRQLQQENTSFSQLVESVRHREASALIISGQLSITEISERLGYANIAAFNRAFKRWYGLSPKQFRQLDFFSTSVDTK